jgi:predicted component of type VI protein secretion system
VPSDDVTSITSSHVDVSLTPGELDTLPEHTDERGFQLGMVGLFRKHVGWVKEKDR